LYAAVIVFYAAVIVKLCNDNVTLCDIYALAAASEGPNAPPVLCPLPSDPAVVIPTRSCLLHCNKSLVEENPLQEQCAIAKRALPSIWSGRVTKLPGRCASPGTKSPPGSASKIVMLTTSPMP